MAKGVVWVLGKCGAGRVVGVAGTVRWSVAGMHIRFARNAEEVRASLRSFNEEARRDAKRVRALVAQSYRCVYDPQERASGVARFVA